jgi:class 3 adenylate cyclase/YHS domain-containing protein
MTLASSQMHGGAPAASAALLTGTQAISRLPAMADGRAKRGQRRRVAARQVALLGSYVNPEVVEHIMSDGRSPLQSGVRLPVVVLFADLRGFTRIAERLPAEHVVEILDQYFEAMSPIGLNHGGSIDKLIGDSLMVLYGVGSSRGDEASRAVRTAMEMQARFGDLRRRWRRRHRQLSLGLGIGCAGGDVVVANVGSPARMDYTVVGATVNLAARLVAAAPAGVTLVSASVRSRLPAGAGVRFGRARELTLKGFGEPMVAYAVLPAPAPATPTSPRSKTRVDPVCGMKIEQRRALTAIRRGRRFYFCSESCRREFCLGTVARVARRRPKAAPRRR